MAKTMNMSLLAKIGWLVLTHNEETRRKLIRSKYRIREDGYTQFKEKQRASHI